MTTLSLVLRGLRSRAVLSAASLVMMVVAVAGTVLGPAFQDAVTASYTLTRLDDADDALTALTFQAAPGREGTLRGLADEASARVREVVPEAYGAPEVLLQAGPFVRGVDDVAFGYAARAGACDLLEVEGRCPAAADEVVLNEDDMVGLEIGGTVALPRLGRPTIVGSYATPADTSDWLLPGRLASRPAGAVSPYVPAPVLRAGANEIVVLELEQALAPVARFVAQPSLGQLEE